MRIQLHHLVAEAAARAPAAPAVTVRDSTLSYGELWQRVAAVGAGLRGLGLAPGERVAVYLDKRVETVPAIFGTSAPAGCSCRSTRCSRPVRWPTSSVTATPAC